MRRGGWEDWGTGKPGNGRLEDARAGGLEGWEVG